MALQLKFLREGINELYQERKNHGTDSGYDLVIPDTIEVPPKTMGFKIHLGVSSKPTELHGYYLMPRSSIIKTPLRQSNSIGLIDAGYRGELIAAVDNYSDDTYLIEKGIRLFQLVFPNLQPFNVEFVNELDVTERGEGGFGSTGH